MIGSGVILLADQTMGQLGAVLQEELQRLKWSQNKLADEAGVGHGTVSKVIRGLNRPDVDTLRKLANALQIDIDKLIDALNNDIMSEQERARVDAIPEEEIEVFLMALREEIERDKSKTLMNRLKKILGGKKSGAS
jgi:transcriptional regulator with XRE-family HTH domain